VRTLLTSLARAFAGGIPVDWTPALPTGARHVPLPTYAFQHQRLWAPYVTTPTGAGTGHPLLTTEVALGGGGALLMGHLSASSWLADHAVAGAVLLPGTGFVEFAFAAGGRAGFDRIEELTLHAPLILPEQGGRAVQVLVEPAGDTATVTVYSRPENSTEDWTRHASGVLTHDTPEPLADLEIWPPASAEPVLLDRFYERAAARGYEYGPAFQGLRRAWRRDGDVFAEVVLPEEATGFGLHPALLDAALQAIGCAAEPDDGLRLPFSWTGVSLRAEAATFLRVVIRPSADGVSVTAFDADGRPVLSVRELVTRSVAPDQVSPQPGETDSLFRLHWIPRAALSNGTFPADFALLSPTPTPLPGLPAPTTFDALLTNPPSLLILACPSLTGGPHAAHGGRPDSAPAEPGTAHDGVAWVLDVLRRCLVAVELGGSQLVVVTRRAVAVGVEEVAGLGDAPLWGLVRSAQAENPDRIRLVDLDDPHDTALLASALALPDEPQVAVRHGGVLVPRLARVATTEGTPTWGEGAVVITGGTGVLGSLVARHLAAEHGVRRLALLSRQGEQAPEAARVRVELAEAGARAEVFACNVTDRQALAGVLDRVRADGPITGVVHTAGVLDDGVIESLTRERLDVVLAPKVDAAWYLHELTEPDPLSAFVLFSSAASVFGGPGQGNYAAGNAFLDALAAHRRAGGRPGLSLAWGLWEQRSGLTGNLDETAVARMRRDGVLPMSSAHGLALLDAAAHQPDALLAPVRLNLTGLRAQGNPHALLRTLVPPTRARAAGGWAVEPGLAERLATLSPAEQRHTVLDLIRTQAATVLGHTSADAVPSGQAFTELGFDSLTAVELRNTLRRITGLQLPATLVFNYPTPEAMAGYLWSKFSGGGGDAEHAVLDDIDRMERSFSALRLENGARTRAVARLRSLLVKLSDPAEPDAPDLDGDLAAATADEIFDLIDNELA
jgi:acyl transferase domain-containing protein/acyl carrier protein